MTTALIVEDSGNPTRLSAVAFHMRWLQNRKSGNGDEVSATSAATKPDDHSPTPCPDRSGLKLCRDEAEAGISSIPCQVICSTKSSDT